MVSPMTDGRRGVADERVAGRLLPVERRLAAHLQTWLGAWPPSAPLQVVGSTARTIPGWDGAIHPVIGVSSPAGTVLSVAPEVAAELEPLPENLVALKEPLGMALNATGGQYGQGIFRWSESPVRLPETGMWLPANDPRLPSWLLPFGGEALVALDEQGRYMAGVGLKRHDRYAREIAVGTDPAFRGLGLARRLVSQAARRILADGAIPTYLHDSANLASAHVADASGFPDRGWRIIAFWGLGQEPPG